MPTSIRVGGSFVEIDSCSVRVGGAWATVDEIFVRTGGVWESAFSAVTPQLTAIDAAPTTATVTGSGGDRPRLSLRFNTNGDIEKADDDTGSTLVYSTVGTWLDTTPPDDSSAWEVRLVIDTEDGGDPGTWSGDTTGSFLAISSNRTFTWTKDNNDDGSSQTTYTVTLRKITSPGNSAEESSNFDATIINL